MHELLLLLMHEWLLLLHGQGILMVALGIRIKRITILCMVLNERTRKLHAKTYECDDRNHSSTAANIACIYSSGREIIETEHGL